MRLPHLLAAALLLTLSPAFAQAPADGERTETHPNGKVKLRETYKNGALNGHRCEFDETGRPVSDVGYQNGLKHGSAKYFENGRQLREETWSKGFLVFPQSREDIRGGFARIAAAKIDAKGLPATQVAAVRRLMQHRLVCGVPWEEIALDPEWAKKCAAGARSNALLGRLEHQPTQPPGMKDEEFAMAKEACSHSNLTYEHKRGTTTFADMVDGWMVDDGDNNKDAVGHRRWCLNPSLAATAFGECKKDGRVYGAMWCFDESRKGAFDGRAVCYPAMGYQPRNLFPVGTLWHATLSTKYFRAPQKDKVKVEVRNLAGSSASFDLESAMRKPTVKLTHFAVDNGGVGCFPNAVIFAPENAHSSGRWLVTITGLEGADGKPAELSYVVEFY